jgi:hypothetical protein
MITFILPEQLSTLEMNQLDTFDRIWHLEMDWFESPNQKRGGWSGVGRIELKKNDGTQLNVFIKKQENYGRLTFLNPIKGEPTFRREFKQLSFLQNTSSMAPMVVFYGESQYGGNQRAILVTIALDEYESLESLSKQWLPTASKVQRLRLLIAIAKGLRCFHKLGLVHRALYPKHIFIKNVDTQPEIALIDLEKTRFSPFFYYRAYFDLSVLHRRVADTFSQFELFIFLKEYFKLNKLSKNPYRFFYKWICRLMLQKR